MKIITPPLSFLVNRDGSVKHLLQLSVLSSGTMPRTELTATPALEILLDGRQNPYYAGDTITGRVVRTAPLVSSQSRITFRLNGRTKSKITVQRGQAGTSIYRGRFNLFNAEHNQKQLEDGPIHIDDSGNGQEWPFTITVPSGPDPASVVFENKQKFSYLPLGQRDITSHPLPPVFFTKGVFINTGYQCFVEYFLEAELCVEAAGGGKKAERATLPISVLAQPTTDSVSDELVRRSFLCRISTYRFTQAEGSGSLSFGQRTREFFGSAKVPQLVFSLQVEHPTSVQVDDPRTIPFRLLILPEPFQTSEVIRDTPREVVLTGMTFEIRARTDMMCASIVHPHTANQTRKFGFDIKSAIERRAEPIVLPEGEKAEPLDIAELLDLRISEAAPLGMRPFSRRKGRLYPSFTTYNIKHTHKLRWTLSVSAAGEATEVSDEIDITLLPSPGSELPPYEELMDSPESPTYPSEPPVAYGKE